jgi:hypothetical protein
MKKFIFTRTAIVLETFEIMAEDEWAAGEQLKVGPAPVSSEFVDWYTDDFVLEDGDDTVCCMDCLSHIPKEKSFATTAGRIVCGDCADSTI